jgi:Predicted nucleotidyltransferases
MVIFNNNPFGLNFQVDYFKACDIIIIGNNLQKRKAQRRCNMTSEKYTIEEIKSIIEPIARKYGVERVYLFGSYARGNATENSDIDFRVDKGSLKGLFALCGLYTEIEEALKMKVDVLTTGSLEDDFLRKIQKEEVLLYAG